MIFQCRKAAVQLPRLSLQCLANSRRGFATGNLQRVPLVCSISQSFDNPDLFHYANSTKITPYRTYATTPVSRPKAHTGRTTAARKAPTTSRTKAAKKPAPKTKTAKQAPKAKSTAKPKTRAKPKRKPATKAKAKPKPRKQRALTDEQKKKAEEKKKRADINKLKAAALKPPQGISDTAWAVFMGEFFKAGNGSLPTQSKDASAQFKNLDPERLEHYNHIANQNKVKNQNAYRQWVESYSPVEIYNANLARLNLRRRGVKMNTQKLQDTRQVKAAAQPFNIFNRDRWATGDFKGLKIPEATRLVAREWKALSDNEKKPYFDRFQQDLVRYTQERKTVLNKDVRPPPQAAAAA